MNMVTLLFITSLVTPSFFNAAEHERKRQERAEYLKKLKQQQQAAKEARKKQQQKNIHPYAEFGYVAGSCKWRGNYR